MSETISTDFAFRYRLRYAADVLREVAAHQPAKGIYYCPSDLNSLADRYEADERNKATEKKELTTFLHRNYMSAESSELLAEDLLAAGWRKVERPKP